MARPNGVLRLPRPSSTLHAASTEEDDVLDRVARRLKEMSDHFRVMEQVTTSRLKGTSKRFE